jgi:hypothetical protein
VPRHERRVGENRIEALVADRIVRIAEPERDVVDAIRRGVDGREAQRARIDVDPDHAFAVGGGRECLRSGAATQVERAAAWGARRDAEEAGGVDARRHDVIGGGFARPDRVVGARVGEHERVREPGDAHHRSPAAVHRHDGEHRAEKAQQLVAEQRAHGIVGLRVVQHEQTRRRPRLVAREDGVVVGRARLHDVPQIAHAEERGRVCRPEAARDEAVAEGGGGPAMRGVRRVERREGDAAEAARAGFVGRARPFRAVRAGRPGS